MSCQKDLAFVMGFLVMGLLILLLLFCFFLLKICRSSAVPEVNSQMEKFQIDLEVCG